MLSTHRPMRSEFIEDATKAVCLKGIPKNEDRETIYNFARQLGWVKRLDLPPSRDGRTQNKGFCFVHFSEKDAADRLLQRGVTPYRNTKRILQVEPYKLRSEKDRRSTPAVSGYATLQVSNEASQEVSRAQSPMTDRTKPAPLDLTNVNNDTPRNQPPTPHDINEVVQRIAPSMSQIREEQYPIQTQSLDQDMVAKTMNSILLEEMQKYGITNLDTELLQSYYSVCGQLIGNQVA